MSGTRSRRGAILGVVALCLLMAVGFTQCSWALALTSDMAIARRVESAIAGATDVPGIREKLARYRIIGEGKGAGFFDARDTQILHSTLAPIDLFSFHVSVGHYLVVFEWSIEAEVVVDRDGRVVKIAIRRTADAP